MKLFLKKYLPAGTVALLAAAVLLAALLFDWDSINSYQAYNTTSTTYTKGTVVGVVSETLETAEDDPQMYLGSQVLNVKLTEGKYEGNVIQVENNLIEVHSIKAELGSKLIIAVDDPGGVTPYYSVYSFDRTAPQVVLFLLFALTMLLVGGFKGLRALLGMCYSLALVAVFLLQAIYHGFSPVGVTLITVLLSTGVSLLLLNGFSRRTAVGTIGTLGGLGITALLFTVFSAWLHLSGYNLSSSESLLLVGDATGLSIRHMLLAAVLISALGAVMDVAVSLGASLEELLTVNPNLTRKNLVKSGFNIGKDMIGTMSNTLIMAFAGGALDTLLVLLAYGYSGTQLFSSDYLTIEIAQGLCATLGVILTVPLTTAVAALMYKKQTL